MSAHDGKTLVDFMPDPGVTMDPAAGVRVRREGTTFIAEAGEAQERRRRRRRRRQPWRLARGGQAHPRWRERV